MTTTEEFRILIIDDNAGIHEDFRKVLGPGRSADVDAAAARVFGGSSGPPPVIYQLDFASQGQEGLAKAIAAAAEQRPYAVAFVDMRMPPGWDGVETIAQLWKKDPEIEVVICTAYSDYSWPDLCDRLGRDDRLLILKKPFDVAEICQLASALTRKWALARRANLKTAELERIVLERTVDLRTANEALQRTNEQLRTVYELESERDHLKVCLRAMEQVVGIIGHELRTPLGCIRGLSEMMLKTAAAADERSAGMLQGINRTAAEMAQSLESLLEAARLHSGLATSNWSSFPLRIVCQEAIQTIRPVGCESAVPVVQSTVPADLTMSGDPDAIRRMILNLLGNADRHTSTGQIAVDIRRTGDDELPLIQITVSDTGTGIAANLMERLGQPFALNRGVVGENCVHGTGLGIAICKSIAQAHGGSLDIQSTVGNGTTVVVRLRQDLPEPAEPAPENDEASVVTASI